MDADEKIARLAGRWWGVVHRDQLIAAGLSRWSIDRRVKAKRLHPIHPSVFAVGHPHVEWLGRAYAALLYMGPTAALSHLTAAAIWGILKQHGGRMHVTRPGLGGHTPRSLILHRGDVPRETRHRLRVTTVEETLLALAATQPAPTLQRAVNQADYFSLLDLPKLAAVIATRRPGVHALREALRMAAPTRSGLEDEFYALLRKAHLPPPLANWQIGPYQVDFYWPEHKLVVETDGWSHAIPTGRTRDRRKDAWLLGHGIRVEHVTRAQFERDAGAQIRRVSKALSAACARGAGSGSVAGGRSAAAP